MKQIHILEIDSPLEAQAIRAAAECWGFSVSMTWVANSQQVVNFFSQEPPHDLILICGHGDERGILLPPLADEVKPRFPFSDVLTPNDLASFVRLNGSIILSTCCATGTDALASAFLEHGANCYIGPVDYPEGDPALLFCFHFLFTFLKEPDNTLLAFEAANNQVEGDNKFLFFERPER